MQNAGNSLSPQHLQGPYRSLTQKQCFHLMDHALRFKPPRHFDESLARPTLLKQLATPPEDKAYRMALKEWPVQWVRRDVYTLMGSSLPVVNSPQVPALALEGLGILIEWLNLKRYRTEFLEQYWLNSVLGFTDAMIRHPGGVSQLHHIHDVLEHHPMPWPALHLNSQVPYRAFTHSLALHHTLAFAGIPPWGNMCAVALGYGVHPVEVGAMNIQHDELPAVLELARAYLALPACWPSKAIQQDVEAFWNWLLQAEQQVLNTAVKSTLLGNTATVVLVEGLTEELLFQALMERFNPQQSTLRVLGCGGKTAMPKRYQELRQWYRGMIKLVLDADGHDVQAIINPQLQEHDELYRIPQGSMEDCYGLALFIQAINTLRPGYPPLSEGDYQQWCEQNTVGRYNRSILYQRFWQAQGLEQLDKGLLAKTVATLLETHNTPLPKALLQLASFLAKPPTHPT
jgi:hypothetical protein